MESWTGFDIETHNETETEVIKTKYGLFLPTVYATGTDLPVGDGILNQIM